MCGIAGIHSQNNVASDLFDCLVHLQHRGQDAAGIMTYDDTHMHKAKGMGLARDVFNEKKMSELQGKVGVAHNRYPTHGGFGHGEIQPFWTNVPYGIALAHNGNITNYSDLVNLISEKDKRYLNTSSDTEVLMNLFADQLHSAKKVNSEEEFFNLLCKSIEYIYENVKGSYSIVGMIVGKGLIAFRDPQGIRPLVYGKRTSKKGSDYIFASENSMFYSLEFEPKGNVLPGELYYISESGKKFKRRIKKVSFNPCVFEYVYFSRPDSNLNDVSVYRSRLRMGQNLARSWKNKFPDIEPDIIIPAPSTANTAALSFAAGIGAYITFINSEKLDSDESPDMESKLEKKNTELKQYQQEVSEHFLILSQLMKNLSNNVDEINEHLASSALRLSSSEIGRELLKTNDLDLSVLASKNEALNVENIDIPRDYAPKVPGGVLSEEYGIDANSDSETSESRNNEEIDNSLDEKNLSNTMK